MAEFGECWRMFSSEVGGSSESKGICRHSWEAHGFCETGSIHSLSPPWNWTLSHHARCLQHGNRASFRPRG